MQCYYIHFSLPFCQVSMPDILRSIILLFFPPTFIFGSVIQIVSFEPPALPDMMFLCGHLYVSELPLQLCIRAFHTLHQRCVLAWTEMCRSFSHDISLFSSVTALWIFLMGFICLLTWLFPVFKIKIIELSIWFGFRLYPAGILFLSPLSQPEATS